LNELATLRDRVRDVENTSKRVGDYSNAMSASAPVDPGSSSKLPTQIEELQKAKMRQSSVIEMLRQEVQDLRQGRTPGQSPWQSRRSIRVDKSELRNLQQQRDEEIRAKLLAEERVLRLVAEKDALLEELRQQHAGDMAKLQAERDEARRELESVRQRPVSMFEVPKTPGLFNYRSVTDGADGAVSKPKDVNLSGWVMIPSADGVRQGWRQMRLVVRSTLIMFHEHKDKGRSRGDKQLSAQWFRCAESEAQTQAAVVLDLAAKIFRVTPVEDDDAIHAGAKQIPRIFKIECQIHGCPPTELLVLTPTPEHKRYWMDELSALRTSTTLADPASLRFAVSKLVDSANIPDVRRALCYARIGTWVLFGTPTGLFSVDSAGRVNVIADVKRVTDIIVLPLQHSFVICGMKKVAQLRLFGINAALRGKEDGCKVPESKGAHLFAAGQVSGGKTCLAFAVDNQIRLCDVLLQTYNYVGEIQLTSEPSTLTIVGDKVCVAHDTVYTLYDIDARVPLSLVAKDDPALRFLFTFKVDAVDLEPVTVLALPQEDGASAVEYLLCYSFIGVIVNEVGRQSRQVDLRWFGCCHSFELAPPFLLCYGDNAVQIVRIDTGETYQVLPIPNLQRHGNTEPLCSSRAVDRTWIGIVADLEGGGASAPAEITAGDTKAKKRSSFKFIKKRLSDTGQPIAISRPQDFQHIAHMGRSETSTTRSSPFGESYPPKPQAPQDYYRVGTGSPRRSAHSPATTTVSPSVASRRSPAAAVIRDETTWEAPRNRGSFSMVGDSDPKVSLDSVFKAIGYNTSTGDLTTAAAAAPAPAAPRGASLIRAFSDNSSRVSPAHGRGRRRSSSESAGSRTSPFAPPSTVFGYRPRSNSGMAATVDAPLENMAPDFSDDIDIDEAMLAPPSPFAVQSSTSSSPPPIADEGWTHIGTSDV